MTEVNGNTYLLPYKPPAWLDGKLLCQPTYRLKLANLPTAIEAWTLPGLPKGFTLGIKRDDNTGGTTTGNKIRKLEFLIAEAVDKGCQHVITCGGIQSNHCRATALTAARYGLTPHLFLRDDAKSVSDVGLQGNVLLNRICGARMYITPKGTPYVTELKPRMEKLASRIRETTGEESYLIPVGGSKTIGIFGYLEAFQELINQGVLEDFDDIVVTCGSGGTSVGLALGNYLTGSKLKVHCMSVSGNNGFFKKHATEMLQDLGFNNLPWETILDLIEGYEGNGYEKSTNEELEFITKVAVETGIILDPTYTGKAVCGMLQEMKTCPGRFQGDRDLFVHTGGVFGLFDGRINSALKTEGSDTNQITLWTNLEDSPVL